MSFDIGFASQSPSLPTGGGVAGLGETFSPDLSTGSGTLAMPIDVPHGPNDSVPSWFCATTRGRRTARSVSAGRSPRPGCCAARWSETRGTTTRRHARARGVRAPGARPDGALRPQVDTGDWRLAASGDGYVATDRAGTRFHLGTIPARGSSGRAAAPGPGCWTRSRTTSACARRTGGVGGRAALPRHRQPGAPSSCASATSGAPTCCAGVGADSADHRPSGAPRSSCTCPPSPPRSCAAGPRLRRWPVNGTSLLTSVPSPGSPPTAPASTRRP